MNWFQVSYYNHLYDLPAYIQDVPLKNRPARTAKSSKGACFEWNILYFQIKRIAYNNNNNNNCYLVCNVDIWSTSLSVMWLRVSGQFFPDVSEKLILMPKNILILKDEATTFSRNVGKRLSSQSASFLRRREVSATPLRKPNNLQSRYYWKHGPNNFIACLIINETSIKQ
jgi:hypothetical protein